MWDAGWRSAARITAVRAEAHGSSRGTRHITEQDPHASPIKTKHTPRPQAHASTNLLWIEAVRRYRDFVAAFRRASREWLTGVFEAEFPPYSFRPPPWGVQARIV